MKSVILSGLLIMTPLATAGEYIVKLKPGYSQKSVNFFSQKNVSEVSKIKASFGNYYKISGENINQKNVSLDPAIEYIEKNQTYTIDPVSSDVLLKEAINIQDRSFDRQWGLQNTGRNYGGWLTRGVAGEDTNTVNAWTMTTGSKDIVVAVIDTGIDTTHEDLVDNLWVNVAEKNGQPGVDDDGNGYIDDVHGFDFVADNGDLGDGNGHGTHCAGVIGASHNNIGIRGVMADVKLMGLKFLSDFGSGETDDAIEAIEYAIKAGVNVMSNSWGGGGTSLALEDAIKAANEAGIVFVVAAGNSRLNIDERPVYPASYKVDNVITVGSMDGKGKRSGFSNYGKEGVHIFAPGSKIYSTFRNGRYRSLDGTSMAAPFVSGAMGLMLSLDPSLTPLQMREKLEQTAVRSSKLDEYTTSGRMDVTALLESI